MKRVAIIACDNGLGHVRRCYLIGRDLAGRGCVVDLFAPRAKFNRFVTLFGAVERLSNVDFSTGTSITALRQGDENAVLWHERLPQMESYHVVISDNLPEILHVRPDAVLSGHFFWHDALDGLPTQYFQSMESLLRKHNPLVIASELFASDRVQNCPRYTPVGLFFSEQPREDARNGDALLISGGTTPALQTELQALVKEIFINKPKDFNVVYVDSSLLPATVGVKAPEYPLWVRQATYDTEMYRRIRVAICRPGIGTITDLLQHGGFPICVYERGNREVKENARRVEAAGLGLAVGAVAQAIGVLRSHTLVQKTKVRATVVSLPDALLEKCK